VIVLRNNQFANPPGLVALILSGHGALKLQSDHRLLYKADWQDPAVRLAGVRALVRQLAETATAGKPA